MKVKHSLCCWLLFALSAAAQAQSQKMQDQPDDGQWTDAGEELCGNPLQYSDGHQYPDGQKSEASLDILDWPDART